MKCSKVRDKLSCYLDGELDEATLEAVEKHLAKCAGCREELEALRSVVGFTSIIEETEPPAHLASAIRDRVSQEQTTSHTCAYYRTLLSEYVDSELSIDDELELESHLALCEGCQEALTAMRATVSSVAMILDVEPPKTLRSRIIAATVGESKAAKRETILTGIRSLLQVPRLGYAAAAVATVAVAGSLFVLIPRGTNDVPAHVRTPARPSVVTITEQPSTVQPKEESKPVSSVTASRKVASRTERPDAERLENDSKPSVMIAKNAEVARPAKHSEVDEFQAKVAYKEPTAAEKEVEEQEPKVVVTKPKDTTVREYQDSEPTSTFIRLSDRRTVIAEDTSDYYKDAKDVAEMRRSAERSLRVDVLTKSF